MIKYLLTASLLLLAAAPAPRRESPTFPHSLPPVVVEAEAFQKEKAVLIRFWLPQGLPASVLRHIWKDGKEIEVNWYMIRYFQWHSVDMEVDGKRLQAFDVEGKKIDPKELPTLLKKRSPVVLFKDELPDPYYLRVLRPGTVVFKGPQDELTAPDLRGKPQRKD